MRRNESSRRRASGTREKKKKEKEREIKKKKKDPPSVDTLRSRAGLITRIIHFEIFNAFRTICVA